MHLSAARSQVQVNTASDEGVVSSMRISSLCLLENISSTEVRSETLSRVKLRRYQLCARFNHPLRPRQTVAMTENPDRFFAMLEQQKRALLIANARKGQQATDKPSRAWLEYEFSGAVSVK